MWWERDHGYLAPSDDESALRTRVHTATAQRLTNYSQTVSGVSNLKMKRFSLEWFTVVWSAYIQAWRMHTGRKLRTGGGASLRGKDDHDGVRGTQ